MAPISHPGPSAFPLACTLPRSRWQLSTAGLVFSERRHTQGGCQGDWRWRVRPPKASIRMRRRSSGGRHSKRGLLAAPLVGGPRLLLLEWAPIVGCWGCYGYTP